MRNLFRKGGCTPGLYMFFLRFRSLTGKNFLLVLCATGLVFYNVFTCIVFERLKRDTMDATMAYAELVETALSELNAEQIVPVLKDVIHKSSIPIIFTDSVWNPVMWNNIYLGTFHKRKPLLAQEMSSGQAKKLQKRVEELKKSYPPRPVIDGLKGKKMGFLVYGDNTFLSSLILMPFMEVGLFAVLLILAYVALHNIRVTERSNLWVGLAKETAHQLGTPISSLMGWVEYMRTVREADPPVEPELFMEQVYKICDDMDNDLSRLRKVTARFSQIGSIPTLTPCDINETLRDVANYFQMRLPLLGKRIEMKFDFGKLPPVSINKDLLGWVLENLMKNSVDAISRNDGKIEISTLYIECDKMVRIFHRDNGNGISRESQKKIFAPGYSTKKRGWGLGLTLAKRIVEDYHKGKIYVSWSMREKGTVICVELPTESNIESTKTEKRDSNVRGQEKSTVG